MITVLYWALNFVLTADEVRKPNVLHIGNFVVLSNDRKTQIQLSFKYMIWSEVRAESSHVWIWPQPL